MLTVQIPALLGQKYLLNTQQVGLQFVAPFLGALLGEPIAGYGSDKWMQYRVKKAGGAREPEWRLPFAIPGFLIAVSLGLLDRAPCRSLVLTDCRADNIWVSTTKYPSRRLGCTA